MKHLQKILALIMATVFILCCVPAAGAEESSKETIVADWIWSSDLDHRGAYTTMKELSETGFTDVYLLCKGTLGTLSWDSACEGTAEGYDYDLLQEALDAAEKYGLRLHAWLTVGRDDHYARNHYYSKFYHFRYGYKSKLSCGCTKKEQASGKCPHPEAYMDLRNEDYIAYMEGLVEELCVKYPKLAGIQLDTMRYGSLSYDWGENTLNAFNDPKYSPTGITVAEYNGAAKGLCVEKNYTFSKDAKGYFKYTKNGTVPKGTSFKKAISKNTEYQSAITGAAKLQTLRINTVNEFIKGIKKVMDANAPHMLLTVDIMPEVVGSEYARAIYGQDPRSMSEYVDYLCIMSYAEAYEKGITWAADCANTLAKQGCKVIAGIQFYEEIGKSEPTSIRIFKQIRNVLKAWHSSDKILGYAIFRHGTGIYAGAHVDPEAKTITIKIHNTVFDKNSPQAVYPVDKLVIEMQSGTVAKKVILDPVKWKNCKATISEDGKTITITGKFLKATGNKTITIVYKGTVDPVDGACRIRSFYQGTQYYTLCNTII